ncbi:peroxiredoxin [Phaeovulum vinaykumarii]|uniref:Glutathione-dependent peroxiredoxin n=1 Tax=Phaeovulum vinaykumarii TaxID=407234 RepID=A0A1N7K839_9RHOB|nr:peroxiredoxin [Phaeovulum vinaykumarii]SIS57614.1 Peroxiredoxin [Phaeovulum vinaykumarii]SOB93482.1 peroxiredoxin [Phaeovulum vinaykumarii]
MSIRKGDRLPAATLLKLGAEGPAPVDLSTLTAGRKVVILAVPGAYTGVCTTAHVPSFIRVMADLRAKGVDAVICISVNDPFVMEAWGRDTGATEAGIVMLADAEGQFTRAMGMDFTAPPVGLIGRSQRYAMAVEDGVIRVLHAEDNPGQCDISAGPAMVAAL